MLKPGQGIIGYLKDKGCNPSEIPLDVLRQFQEFEKGVHDAMKSYEGKDEAVTYGMQSYTIVEMLAISLIESGDYPAVKKCHNHLMKLFKNDGAFSDGISLMSWIIFNFPYSTEGRVLAEEIVSRDIENRFSDFINAAINSRLGLYKVIDNSSNECILKEFCNNREIKLSHSLGGIPYGHVALCRVIKLFNKYYIFGHAPEICGSEHGLIKKMLKDKMSLFRNKNRSISEIYHTMMCLSGPYWFSIIAQNHAGDILDADYYKKYYG
jgi:hypothetical protein